MTETEALKLARRLRKLARELDVDLDDSLAEFIEAVESEADEGDE